MAKRDAAGDSGGSDRAERRGGFLAFVAHEVRNPLSTALWSAELLSRMPAAERGGARGEKLSGMCLRSIARVRQLVEDHFLCERLDTAGIQIRPEPLGARDVVEAVLERRPHDLGEVTLDIDPDLAVHADRMLLERAIEAVLAVAGGEGAPVRISARSAPESIAFLVSGRPPSAGALEDPVKGSPSDPRGRALALPLARRIAAALDGTLTEGEGGYVLSLPPAKAYPARPKPAAHP